MSKGERTQAEFMADRAESFDSAVTRLTAIVSAGGPIAAVVATVGMLIASSIHDGADRIARAVEGGYK